MNEAISTKDGYYVGPWRAPANEGRGTQGNIHSDEDAQRLGFRGGLVAGSIHMEQLAPLLVRAFGERWLERGSISLYFLTPTLHGEEVRAVIGVPQGGTGGVPPAGADDAQVEAWMEKRDGTRICEGTAAIGAPNEPSALRARKLDKHAGGQLRILAKERDGDEFPIVDTRVEEEALDRRLAVITEPMPWYTDASRWGGRVPTTVNQVNALMAPASAYLRERQAPAIGLYGAIELRTVHGPMLIGRTYRSGGTLLHAGETPKTEYAWFDTWAEDRGKRVAEMRMMLRFMKASSPVYEEIPATTEAS
jgi:hypothetical protein